MFNVILLLGLVRCGFPIRSESRFRPCVFATIQPSYFRCLFLTSETFRRVPFRRLYNRAVHFPP